MYVTTQAIPISTVHYGDSSIIIKAYTRDYGLISLMAKGARKKGARLRPVFFQPLSLLDITLCYREKNDIHVLTEVRFTDAQLHPHSDVIRSSLALFIAEILRLSFIAQEKNETMFSFIVSTITELSSPSCRTADFHIRFLVQFLKHNGFLPKLNYSDGLQFDIIEAQFTNNSFHPHILDVQTSSIFNAYLEHTALNRPLISLPDKRIRQAILNCLLEYCTFHLPGFKEVKSLKVLTEVFE